MASLLDFICTQAVPHHFALNRNQISHLLGTHGGLKKEEKKEKKTGLLE